MPSTGSGAPDSARATLTTIAVGSIVAEGIGGVIKPALIKIGLIHLGQ